MTVLKYDKVILKTALNEKFKRVGETFEVANILESSFMLRDAKTKVALGVVSFEDFKKHFVKEDDFKGWTPWTSFVGIDGQTDVLYRTNGKRVQVKFLTDKVKSEACCNTVNDFDLFFGLQIAYTRCYNKALAKRKQKLEEELKRINVEITDNERILKSMINSLPV